MNSTPPSPLDDIFSVRCHEIARGNSRFVYFLSRTLGRSIEGSRPFGTAKKLRRLAREASLLSERGGE